ncbi:hypothetical protein MGG_16278 [Pyricularia oryzae 70-15]|uniref:Uncharacterized protein n=1 Tax=Pyricularia oryzae (strain 70-15 / ATCC MYA-4617 / FGSC 8958) TaxID=242507 RepID=G4MQQ4_PYRO7|nr:uncharacterized protein MGG_16278 [Pyricularia oryzae 70-15]EHA57341.1 hypothetical protein MGG_16278 [Pyricularia oryzae 70-15]
MVRQIPITALRAGCSGRVSGNSKHLTQFVWISCEGWARKSCRRSLGGVKWQLKKRWNARTQAYTLFFPSRGRYPQRMAVALELSTRPAVHKVRYAINRQDNPTRRKSTCGAHGCYGTTRKIHFYFVLHNHTCRPAPLNWMRDGEQSNNHPARSPDDA